MGKRLTNLSIEEKINILNELKNNVKKKVLSAKYKCNISTINRIKQREGQIRSFAQSTSNLRRKRQRKARYESLEKALLSWYNCNRTTSGVITNTLLLRKAKELAIDLGEDFEPSGPWLWRWRQRENIKCKNVNEETENTDIEAYEDGTSNDIKFELDNGNDDYIVDTESSAEKRVICDTKVDEYQLSYSENISEYWCNELPKVLRSYSGDCIFSVNVAKLLYKSLPMHHSIDEAAVAIQKLPVPQLTLLFFCNALGSYKRVFAIGKVKIPSHLSNINLPVKYFVTSQAQMQPMLWNLILKSLDDEMIAINKRIMLIVNSNLGRMLNCELQNVNVSILPGTDIDSINPDQPLQQGIIGSFKMQYMRILMNKQLLGLEKGKKLQEFLKSITIFDALFYIKKAWSEVTPNIIKSSFEKVGGHRVSSEGVIKDLNRASPAFKFIGKESLDCNEFENTHMIQDTKRKFTNCDDLVNGNDFEKFAEENFSPTLKEALVALEVLQNYCQHRNADVNNSLDKIEEYLLQTTIQRCI